MDLFDFMFDVPDDVSPLRRLPDDMEEIMPRLHAKMRSLSVRARNAVRIFFDSYDNSVSRIYRAVSAPRFTVKSMKNVGSNTAPEVESFLSYFISVVDSAADSASPADDIENLMPVIMSRMGGLSVRARNALTAFFEANGNSVIKIYSAITVPRFSARRMRNIGRTTAPEVMRFLSEVRSLVDGLPDSGTRTVELDPLSELQMPEEFLGRLSALKESLGHFPMFAAIDAYLNGLDGETSAIVNGCIRIRNSQNEPDSDAVAESLGLTKERVRQKRNLFIRRLEGYCSMLRAGGLISDNPYDFVMTHTEEYVNAAEGTDFTADFVRWALASAFEDVALIGDAVKSLACIRKRGILAAVPAGQCSLFDFNAFVGAVDSHMSVKRTNPERADLGGFVSPFFISECSDAERKEVEMSCRSVMYLNYSLESDGDAVIFPANARKNNTEIIEDILRMTGHTMTLDEIYAEFVRLYPERNVAYSAFRGNISNNPSVVPLGRSSTYSLAEWRNGSERGGTIRKFADEYLDSVPGHIAPVDDVCGYVRQFRPSSNDGSIVSNLLMESGKKYAVYVHDGRRCVGYRSDSCDPSYVLLTSVQPRRRSKEESMELLTGFIDEHGRFPAYQRKDPEERRLYNFVNNMECLHDLGKMDEPTADMWLRFKEKYADCWPSRRKRNRRSPV